MADHNTPRTSIQPTSPGHNRAPIEGAISLRELPWCGKINVRGAPDDARFLRAFEAAVGRPPPLQANTTSAGENGVIFWLGPDEWLLHCAMERSATLQQQLAQQLATCHHAATEVSDYYTVLELSGENAAEALARGCPLDLHEREFRATQCAQTRFGNASVMLYQPAAERSFQIQVRWSFTAYLWDYLATVMDAL